MKGIILYGPPAAGKDTLTATLSDIDPSFRLFQRIKVGIGRTSGYRLGTTDSLTQMRERGEVLWENFRYGSWYVVDSPGLLAALRKAVPVLHLGQPEAISRIQNGTPASWLVVELACSRSVARQRLIERDPLTVEERLIAYDQTPRLQCAHLYLDTSTREPTAAAEVILQRFHAEAT